MTSLQMSPSKIVSDAAPPPLTTTTVFTGAGTTFGCPEASTLSGFSAVPEGQGNSAFRPELELQDWIPLRLHKQSFRQLKGLKRPASTRWWSLDHN